MVGERTVVVCGATGQQGSQVVEALQRRGVFRVRALTRDTSSTRAREMASRGVEMVRGDLSDMRSLACAFQDAQGVFGITQPWTADYRHVDVAGEIAQGQNVVDACKRARIAHLVLSTAMRVDDEPTGIAHVDSKMQVERYLRTSGVPYTVLRPGTFMDNIGKPFFPVKNGTVRGFVAGDARLPFISCRDIGVAAATVLEAPDLWSGRSINLMSDWISGLELCRTLARVENEPYRYAAPPALVMRVLAPEFFRMRQGFEKAGRPPYPYRATFERALEDTRRLVSDVWNLERYLEVCGIGRARQRFS